MKRQVIMSIIIPFSIWLVGCQEKKQPVVLVGFAAGKRLAELDSKKLEEVSGLAASINNPGLLWTQNDSGNGAEIFLIDQKTKIKQTYILNGVKNRDWEDIAVGSGPDPLRHYLYVAEIGDNLALYRYKTIYRFEEPLLSPNEKTIRITQFDTITFELSDTKRDAEAILLDPKTKDLYIFSKSNDPSDVYQLTYPYATKDTSIAKQAGSLPINRIVAADFSRQGDEILIKNYNHVYYWKNDGSKSVMQLLQEPAREIPYEQEPQGEAIAWAADGSGFYTLSERVQGKKTYLYYYQRK
ncbi:MAG TPA: hypothetical protein VK666_02355 [Chryseolinea sp.]|nr:hypothetical protein [Chryseolinea sp.]